MPEIVFQTSGVTRTAINYRDRHPMGLFGATR